MNKNVKQMAQVSVRNEDEYTLISSNIRMLDEEKFSWMYVEFYPAMLAYARNFVTPDDAEEAVQDVMVWLWENRKTLEIKTSLKNYLFRAVRNCCMSRIAYGQAQQRLRQAIFDRIQPYYEDADNYTSEILIKKIEEAFSHLPESYRITFEKSRFEDKTYPEIAAELDISVKTVEYRISKALKQLRFELKEYLPMTSLAILLSC